MATDASFNGVRVKRLDDEGSSQDVYKNTVSVKAEYDPKGMMVNILVLSPRLKLLPITRRYGPLRGPTSSSCGGLRPRLFLPFGQKKSFSCCFGPFLAIFGVQ